MKLLIRDSLARFSRFLPFIRGKNRIGLPLIDLLTNWTSEAECIVNLRMYDGSQMTIDLRSFEKKCFLTGEYDSGVIRRLSKILEPGCTVLDVGANIGFYSIALGMKLKQISSGSDSRLYAIEAVKPNFNRLRDMVISNDLQNIVHLINIALGDFEGNVSFHMTDEGKSSTGNAMWVKNRSMDRSINCEVYMTTLDKLSATYNINSCDLIKVDIEGAELDFLFGGIDFISKTRPIIYSEFNLHCASEFGWSFKDLYALMSNKDYAFYEQKGRDRFVELKNNLNYSTNILIIPQEKISPALYEKLGIIRN